MNKIRPEIESLNGWLLNIRREIHKYPETGYKELRTSGLVQNILSGCGLLLREKVGGTGVIGLWKADKPGPCVGLRADMDALPIEEAVDHPWRSTLPGIMHACGHDIHVAMLLGAARVLVSDPSYKQRLAGSVKLIFQPAEEEGAGAGAMIADGALKDPAPDVMFSSHVVPLLEVGMIGYTKGASMAAVDNFTITVKGRGGHAAHPDLAADPIAPAARLVDRLRESVRNLEGALMAVCTFHSGTRTNVIPEKAVLSGTIRSLKPSAREKAQERLKDTAGQLARETGLAVNVRLDAGYPMLINDPETTDRLVKAAENFRGSENVIPQGPTYGSEDMAFFLEKVPGVHFWLGCGRPNDPNPAMLHSPGFDPDESVMPFGVEFLIRLVEEFLAPK